MLPSFSQWALLFALAANFPDVSGIMVESVDGSFVPWSLVARAPGKPGLTVLLKNNKDLSYLSTVRMGSPPQQIQMAASLSQDHISVASAPQGVNDGTFYNPSISSSYLPGDASTTIPTISGGSTTGRFAGELCTLQSATLDRAWSYNATVVLTDPDITNDLYPAGARAILGYGVNAPADSPAGTSLIGSFLPENFTNAVCGIELNHFDDPVPDGILMMGAVDSSAFLGDFTNMMVPQSSLTSWSIPVDNLTYLANGLSQSVSGSVASVDIYHSGIEVTNEVARQIYSGISGARALSDTLWSLPCNSTFPITLTFAGKTFTIYERDTIVKQADGTCTGAVTGGAQEIGKVGAPFLRNVYTQFGAVRAADGSVTFSVGFALKNLRQVSSQTTASTSLKTTIGPTASSPTGLPSTSTTTTSGAQNQITIHALPKWGLAVVSIVAVIFL